MSGQTQTALRSRFGPSWPLTEFWKDEVKEHRKVVNQFVDPFLHRALANKLAKEKATASNEKIEDAEELTLLDHLINHTEGSWRFLFIYLGFAQQLLSDKTVLQDEVIMMLYIYIMLIIFFM